MNKYTLFFIITFFTCPPLTAMEYPSDPFQYDFLLPSAVDDDDSTALPLSLLTDFPHDDTQEEKSAISATLEEMTLDIGYQATFPETSSPKKYKKRTKQKKCSLMQTEPTEIGIGKQALTKENNNLRAQIDELQPTVKESLRIRASVFESCIHVINSIESSEHAEAKKILLEKLTTKHALVLNALSQLEQGHSIDYEQFTTDFFMSESHETLAFLSLHGIQSVTRFGVVNKKS